MVFRKPTARRVLRCALRLKRSLYSSTIAFSCFADTVSVWAFLRLRARQRPRLATVRFAHYALAWLRFIFE